MLKALVLAAGYGTRLLPLTTDRSKVTLPLAGVPVLVRVLRSLRAGGVGSFAVNLHHAPHSVRSALERWGEAAEYSLEPEILGTGGALDLLRGFLAGGAFLLVNGDCHYGGLPLAAALEFHRRRGALATMVLMEMPPGGYRGVRVDREGRLLAVAGRPEGALSPEGSRELHFPGVHILEPEFLAEVGPGFSDINRDIYPALIRRGAPVYGFRAAFDWADLGTPGRFLEVSRKLLLAETPAGIRLGPGCRIDPTAALEAPLELEEDCRVEAGCSLACSLVLRGAALERDVRVRESLVGEGVRLEAGARIERCLAALVQGRLEVRPW